MLLTQEQIYQLGIPLSTLQQHSKDILATWAPKLPILGPRQAILAPSLATQSHHLAIQVLAPWAFLSNTSQCIISQVDLQWYHGCQHHQFHQTAHQAWNI